jgi:hypothetical protein
MLRLGFRHNGSLKQAGAQNSLSPVDAEGAGDGASTLFRVPESLVNIAHFFRIVRKTNGPQRGGKLRPVSLGLRVPLFGRREMIKLSR